VRLSLSHITFNTCRLNGLCVVYYCRLSQSSGDNWKSEIRTLLKKLGTQTWIDCWAGFMVNEMDFTICGLHDFYAWWLFTFVTQPIESDVVNQNYETRTLLKKSRTIFCQHQFIELKFSCTSFCICVSSWLWPADCMVLLFIWIWWVWFKMEIEEENERIETRTLLKNWRVSFQIDY